ncbi:hypothetical protein K3495_g9318 [Podosphaera aphanis]|nr:hypothetical protein K3495_g9318 [Podosphaera aphanis]
MQPRVQLFNTNYLFFTRVRPLIDQSRQQYVVSSICRGLSSNQSVGSIANRNVFGRDSEEANSVTRNQRFSKASGNSIQNTKSNQNTTSQRNVPRTIQNVKNPSDFSPSNNVSADDINQVIGKNDDASTSLHNLLALNKLQNASDGLSIDDGIHDPLVHGHKFGLPELPIPKDANFKYRSDPIVLQVTNLLMKDGKKSVAQRNMSFILNLLRTAPPPTLNPARPLLPGHPPPHHLPLDPVAYLTLAIDSVAPLLRIRSERGAAGGGAALQIPVPLAQRQRRRQAVMWILDSVNKRQSRGSGRGMFAKRFADEIINVIEGKSSAWDKRNLVHKTGTTARNNINFRRRR